MLQHEITEKLYENIKEKAAKNSADGFAEF
jgi:hypothetical protein